MTFIEIAGYAASGLVLATFCMRTMIPLRVTAIGSNVAFITYGALGELTPILLLHLVLLPLNIYRTVEVLRLLKRVRRAARGDLSMDWLKPYMKSSAYPSGHVLFRKDEPADRLYMILEGEVRLVESGTVLPPGELLGEIGLFSPSKQRTQTALCETLVELLWISEQDLAQLCYQHPGMAFYLLRLITARMIANIERVEKRPLPEAAASDVSAQVAATAF